MNLDKPQPTPWSDALAAEEAGEQPQEAAGPSRLGVRRTPSSGALFVLTFFLFFHTVWHGVDREWVDGWATLMAALTALVSAIQVRKIGY